MVSPSMFLAVEFPLTISVMEDLDIRFPIRDFSYNPEVDLQEVDQFGFINLSECYEKGIIPGGVDLTDESFNGVSAPGTLISRSQDVFDGLRKAEYVKNQLSRLGADEREKVEKSVDKSVESAGQNVTS